MTDVEAAAYLIDQAGQHDEVRRLILSVSDNLGVPFTEIDPEHLIELAEAVKAMNEEAPISDAMDFETVWGKD